MNFRIIFFKFIFLCFALPSLRKTDSKWTDDDDDDDYYYYFY